MEAWPSGGESVKKIIRIREGDSIPSNAKFVDSKREPDHTKTTRYWAPSPGVRGMIPIFGMETLYESTPLSTFFYYEVEE